jgi:hypothetical protein
MQLQHVCEQCMPSVALFSALLLLLCLHVH